MKSIFVLIIGFFFTISTVIANGAGNYIDKTVGGFLFEFGREPKEPIANERVIMSLSVHNSSTKEPLDIESLWIRISKGNEILFTSGDFRIKKEGPLFFGYAFKESGNYAIDFSFKQDGRNVKTDFNVSIKKDYTAIFGISIALILAFIFGYATASMAKKRKL